MIVSSLIEYVRVCMQSIKPMQPIISFMASKLNDSTSHALRWWDVNSLMRKLLAKILVQNVAFIMTRASITLATGGKNTAHLK